MNRLSCILLPLVAMVACKKEAPQTPKPAEKATVAAAKASPEAEKPSASPTTEAKKAVVTAKPAAPAAPPAEMAFPEAVDIGDFGSEEPVEREDLPSRGIIQIDPDECEHKNEAHWETYTWANFKTKRWGKYQVRLTYTLTRSSLGMQFRMGDLVVKKPFKSAQTPRQTYLGTVYVPQAGPFPFALLTPPTDDGSFKILEIALVPTCEGSPVVQAPGKQLTLHAKDATTWSENMRYEPKPEKNCLGFWTDAEDFAEWEFQVEHPGKYEVTVTYGCGGGNHGSEVELKQDTQSLRWKTEDTGGFQKWRDAKLGLIELKQAGTHRLVIDPVNKVKSAVLDVQKVVLKPVP